MTTFMSTDLKNLASDVQERFRDLIYHMPDVIDAAKLMVDSAHTLEIPCIVTEQYPRALGHTVPEIQLNKDGLVSIFEKTRFSMITSDVDAHLSTLNRTQAVIFGIETHVCVLQTCLDLLERGYDVHVAVDGVSSQRTLDRTVALERLRSAGCILTTTESCLFQLMEDSRHPNFRTVSQLVKDHNQNGERQLSHL